MTTTETCPRCGRPVMRRVTTDGGTVVLNAHALSPGFDLFVVLADLRVVQRIGFVLRGYDRHVCGKEA